MNIKIDKRSPYPYLPGYDGTTDDRSKIIKRRLKILLAELEALEIKLGQNQNDIPLLADIEKCHLLVRGMLED